jgi:hypothetical protein
MERRTKIILLVIVSVLIIMGIVLFLLNIGRPGAPTPGAGTTNTNTTVGLGTTPGTPPAPTGTEVVPPPPPATVSDDTKLRTGAQNLSVLFAERLGSFSNQSGLTNITDLKSVSTAELYNYLTGTYKTTLMGTLPPADKYYGVTSKVVGTNIDSIDSSSATVTVTMQRTESGTVSNVSTVTRVLTLTRSGDTWLVSRFKVQ